MSKKKSGWEGYSSKSHWNSFLYIGKICFVINRPGEEKNNSKKENFFLFVSSFRGAHSRLTRTISQQKIRALVSSHRDRDRQKRDFRRLWITRINAVIRERGVYYNYSQFIHDLYKKKLLLNRKILAQIAILNRNCIFMIFNEIIQKEDWKKEYLETI